MHNTSDNGTAVSGVVGEMLMIGIVLILVAVFSASLADQIPSSRSPTVTIVLNNDTGGNITLWHKGGDWVKTGSLRVIVSNTTYSAAYSLRSEVPLVPVPDAQAFDLGDNITVTRNLPFAGDEDVSLATDRAVIFSGTVGRRT
ncbi:MAG: type IV pilin N-terminal domain-containing protein [Methanoregula sp.]